MAQYKKGSFKTAYDQREIILDAKVTQDFEIGAIVTNEDDTGLTASQEAKLGSYIIAQSDESMEYGHIPVENRDYRYSNIVKKSTEATKKVAVFRIDDPDDIIVGDTVYGEE